MAERQTGISVEGCDTSDDVQNKGSASECSPRATKTTPSRGLSPGPPKKSPCALPPEAAILPADGTQEEPLGLNTQGERQGDQDNGPFLSPRTRRKSWRRSARGRRSLPAPQSNTLELCEVISSSLPEEERLGKLIEASMKLAVQKLEAVLRSAPEASMEVFHSQVESVQQEWQCLEKEIRESAQNQPSPPRDSKVQEAMEKIRKSIHSLQVECGSWESLLQKHRSRAEELARRVEQGRTGGLPLDPSCLAQSSQSQVIMSKPDYNSALCRQQTVLHTMELTLDTHCKILRGALSYQEQCQALIRETSGRLASTTGFQELPSSPVRKLLMAVPQPSCKLGSAQ
ncbi:kinetochore-associated protein DSN1 homolog [Paramormyrops kingsleyae]|uniref:kinetochore-associated protein DSN1 homolog n=1 Tax=Paramormyrops kingsleyae TaxID=1676925 RepID=UPI000CD62833|nr:kinetochore-associated protein DSN1 homolog [Paramormyrops kingsleyae]